jgi:uncharacterized Tic20 family protein
MTNSLPRRVRVCAALCHLSGLLWLTGGFTLMAPSWLQLWLIGLSLLLPCLTWLFTRRVHDFVDRSGREVVNAQLSALLYMGCAIFITAIACGMSANMHTATPLGIGAGMMLFFGTPFCGMIYTIISIAATIQALWGNVLHYPLIIRFIPNPSDNF